MEAPMRGGLWLIAIVVVVFGLYHFMHSGAPSTRAVEPVLRSYLESRCGGEVDIGQLDSIRVGAYSEQLGGWPVYANHTETCVQNSMKTTYDGGHDADNNVAVAMVRRTASGRLEMFTPGFVQDAGREMQQMLNHAFDSAQTH
jgi:hypothetical protein